MMDSRFVSVCGLREAVMRDFVGGSLLNSLKDSMLVSMKDPVMASLCNHPRRSVGMSVTIAVNRVCLGRIYP